MTRNKSNPPGWIIEARVTTHSNLLQHAADENKSMFEFEQVGDKLVTTDFIKELLEYVDGKKLPQPFVISIPELVDEEFLQYNVDSLRAVVADCLIMLFDTQRLVIRSEE